MTIDEYFGDWYKIIPIKELKEALSKINTEICPERNKVFRAFKECSYNKVKVILTAQDPYPQKGIANGLAFGNDNEPLSPSLEVIKEACIDYTIPHYGLKFDNTLESWAKQGVLLLNSALTCEINKPGSHTMIWRPFISKFLYNLSISTPGLVYVLLGSQADSFRPYIMSNDIIRCAHPSYYARTKQKMPNIFKEINNILLNKTCEPIEWFTEFK